MNRKISHRIGVLMADESNPFWVDMKRHYDRLAKGMDLEVLCLWPNSADDPSTQSDLLFEMIGSGFDAIIINPLNNNNLVSGISVASSMKIPILDVGAKTDERYFEETPAYYVPIETVDFSLQGRLGAEYILKRLGPGERHNIALIEGRPDSAQSLGRSEGAFRVFKESPETGLIFREGAGFDRGKAGIVTREIFRKGQEISAFFCVNDLMALGVADALSDQKGLKRPVIVGVDLIDEARDAIKKGIIDASIAFSRAEVAASVLQTAKDLIAGIRHPSISPVSSHLVTIENIRDFDD